MAEKKYPLKLNKDFYVVTANDLIKGKQKMDLRESKLLAIAISQVVKEDKDFKTYTTTVPELAAFMGVDENSLYRDLEGICRSLCHQIVEVQVGGENTKRRKKWKIFHWISSAEYDDGKLTLRLSDDIKPFLLELDGYYSQTLLGTLMTFQSYYATRLYQYLVAETNARWGNIEQWTFTCEQLRDLFQPYIKNDKGEIIKELYPRNYDLVRKTIKPALEELRESDFAYVWDYEENKATTRGKPLKNVSFKAIFFESKEKKEWYLKKSKPIIDQLSADKTAQQAADQSESEQLDGQLSFDETQGGEKNGG